MQVEGRICGTQYFRVFSLRRAYLVVYDVLKSRGHIVCLKAYGVNLIIYYILLILDSVRFVV